MKRVTYIISDIDKALAFEWIALHIDKKKIDLSFLLLTSQQTYLQLFLQKNGIKATHILFRGKNDWPLAWWKTYQFLKKNKPDIVHCHLLQASIIGLSAAYAANVKSRIYTRHHSDFHFRYFPKGVKWDKCCNKMATNIIAPSHAVKYVLTEYEKVNEKKISLIHHSFDLDYFSGIPDSTRTEMIQKYNPSRQVPVIGIISRFTALKGIQYIIPAFKKLLAHYPEALLLLFNARGDYADEIEYLLQGIPASNYKTIPFENELAGVYALFDIFVQASTDTTIEAFGQTYVEALAAGIPSVFTLSGVAAEFIKDRENAMVVPFKNSDAIYDAMIELLENPSLRERLKLAGIKDVRNNFTLQNMIRQLEMLYGS